ACKAIRVATLGGLLLPMLTVVPQLRAAETDSLAAPRKLWLGGHYSEAEEQYAKLADDEPAAALSVARCQAAVGERDKAVESLTAAGKKHPRAAALPAELALLAFERGDYAAADAAVDTALKLDKNQLVARWVRAELHRVRGQLQEADQSYHWFV